MSTDLHIRGVSDGAATRFRRGARVRGLTLGEYLERLEHLHQVARAQEHGQMPPRENSMIAIAELALPTED